MPFPYDPDLLNEGFTLPPLEVENEHGQPGFVLNVSLPSPQVEEPPLRYLGSLDRSGQGVVRSTPTSLSRNSRPTLRRGGSGSLSSLAISGLELRDLNTTAVSSNESSREASGHMNAAPPDAQASGSSTSPTETQSPQQPQRVSFDNPPSPPMIAATAAPDKRAPPSSRKIRKSDPPTPSSPILRALAYIDRSKDANTSAPKHQEPRVGSYSPPPSRPRSRATSPLRILQQWSSGLYGNRPRTQVEERFVPINPFKPKPRSRPKRPSPTPKPCLICLTKQQRQEQMGTASALASSGSALIDRTSIASSNLQYGCTHAFSSGLSFNISKFTETLRLFFGDTLPRTVYLNFLLHLPVLYFSRVARIFEDAEVSKPDIQRMIEAGGGVGTGFFSWPSSSEGQLGLGMGSGMGGRSPGGPPLSPGAASGIGISSHVGNAPASMDWAAPLVPPALMRFKVSWEMFIDSLMREWKTLNLISALLLSSIMSLFQAQAAASDPVIRNAAFMSLICALWSLSYGCMYIIRFGTMRSMYRASRWAEEARKSNTALWWNVWVFLAMPSVWMAWSMMWFLVAILSFVWRTGAVNNSNQPAPLSVEVALVPRIGITAGFVLGLVYFVLIVRTLQRYGTLPGRVGGAGGGVVTMAMESGAGKSYDAAERGEVRRFGAEQERRGRERERRSVSRDKRGEMNEKAAPVMGLGLTHLDRPRSLDLEK
ncbi:hypothetical protein APHAL10511_008675 [Amanita phalloides]|nr:hypothetical protein APHAL10511_008675 [Amanita phalloides]